MDAGRGRKLGRRQDSKESRDSSVSSTTREVRCGCQYFQSDSLLPERHTLVGTRPSSRNMGDHEYEPINPPPSQPASPPLLKVTDQEGQEKIGEPEKIEVTSKTDVEPMIDMEPQVEEPPETEDAPKIDFTPIINRSEHQYLRIPLDRDLVIPIGKEEIESIRYDDDDEEEMEQNAHEMTMQDIQDQMENRLFSATPTTTISRTDGEFNTSQMDSSGLDELPLKKDARRGFNTRGFQQRLQSQAGRLRTRIRNISRPKINFPERPKLHLPERPKFNFPERPKFNLPDRPKFNIKRPDIKIPNFNFGKTKTSSIRRPLRDRSQIPSNQSTAGSKKNIFDTINFRTYPRIFSKKKKAAQGRRALTPPPRMETESTPPSSPASRTGPFNQKWTQRFKDIKFADDDSKSDLKKPSFDDEVEDDSAAFRDTDFKAALVLSDKKQMKATSSTSIPGSDKEQQSSGSSSERHRAGVIEEIDSDEFFLREKGLSREDVDVSRYLSLEIRDAFRSPKNALARLDGDLYDEDIEDYKNELQKLPISEPIRLSMEAIRNQSLEQIRMSPERETEYTREEEDEEPVRPERTRSLKKHSTRSRSEGPELDAGNQFNTFPPNRPTRVRKQSSQSKHSIPLDGYTGQDNENVPEDINTEMRQPSIPSLAITDTTKELSPSRYIDESSEALDEAWIDQHQPPLPPKRRKSTRDSSLDNESLSAHHYKEQWLEDVHNEDMVLDNMNALQREVDQNRAIQNGYYDSPPQLPMRKSRSQGTSLGDEDRTSRGADSLISETRTHLTEELDIKPESKAFIPDTSDYAVVEKTIIEAKPTVNVKPTRPPPPSRKKKTAAQLTALKNQSINFFFTYPRRAIKKTLNKQPLPPIRPIRNYSSIGPSRPPRRNRVFREPVYEGEFIPLKDENEEKPPLNKDEEKEEFIESEKIEHVQLETEADDKSIEKSDHEEVHETRDLQSGDVIEKMKGRPLPPPPRPPRKTREDFADRADEDYRTDEDDREVEVTDLDEESEVIVERIDILVGHPYHHEETKREMSPIMPPSDVFKPEEEICDRTEEQHEAPPRVPVTEPPVKAERRKKSLSVTRRAPTPVAPIEASVSTQTDTLPEGFYVEEEQQTSGDYKFGETPIKISPGIDREVEVEKKIETIVEHKVVVIPTPETEILKAKKIHVSELDVEKLNVAELQAQKITVSDIDGVSMQVAELTSKSGHLVISGFELPSSFLEAITPLPPPPPVIQIQSSTQTLPSMTDSQTNTTPQELLPSRPIQEDIAPQPSLPTTPPLSQTPLPAPIPQPKRPSPPPTIVVQSPQGQYIPSSPPPPRPRSQAQESEEELRMLPRRRRHHSHKHSTQYSSDEEDEASIDFPSFPIARRSLQREPNATELIRQLLALWQASLKRNVNQVIDGLNAAFPEGEKRKDAQTAACIILVLVAGLMMLGFGSDKTVHHHHWDFLPPHP